MRLITGNEIRERLKGPTPLLTGLIDPDVQIQPNGIDLTVASIHVSTGRESVIDFDNSDRTLSDLQERVYLVGVDRWYLSQGAYLARYNERVNIPNDVFAITKVRSSLFRSGVTLHSSMWDSGYCGTGCGLLVVHSSMWPMTLHKNARIAQMCFFQMDHAVDKPYEGMFQNE